MVGWWSQSTNYFFALDFFALPFFRIAQPDLALGSGVKRIG
jgi:hypothetical protein